MRLRNYLYLAILALLPLPAAANFSDLTCDDSARLQETLTDVLGASRHGMGLRDPDTMLEVWILPRNSEWLIVQNYSNGTSCIVAMGEHWEDTQTGPA